MPRAVNIGEMEEFRKKDAMKAAGFEEKFNKSSSLGLLATGPQQPHHYIFLSFQRKGRIPQFALYFEAVVNDETISLMYDAYRNIVKLQHSFLRVINS
ncbi:hypothetical protein PoB_000880300 [Plakobranchus ocellatus]|uniref:Uncharacterized protein n=1 Tax=Plakobranchus ocellatus TaxID=259542 RepID=A0AAV3YJA4_9GAST|nr:hypothetical protein PoB_000880300 [Plakobranchus ocellatus]